MENLRNRIGVQLVNNKKEHFKCSSKQSYRSYKIYDNNLVAVGKSKLELECAYIGMCIFELSKVLIYEFYYRCNKNMTINQNCYLQKLIV